MLFELFYQMIIKINSQRVKKKLFNEQKYQNFRVFMKMYQLSKMAEKHVYLLKNVKSIN